MAFVANIQKLIKVGELGIDNPPGQYGPSIDIPIGDIFWINRYVPGNYEYENSGNEISKYNTQRRWKVEDEYGQLEENDRKLFGEAEYIAFTKSRIELSPDYEFFIDPRSSFARLGLQASVFEKDILSKYIHPKKLPEFKGRVPIVLRTMRTNLLLPEHYNPLQLLVRMKGTAPLTAIQLLDAIDNKGIEVMKDGENVSPTTDGFPLTFHHIIKKYKPPSHILSPDENTEKYFQTFDMSDFGSRGFRLDETCFYLGSTAETTKIGNRHLGMLTQNYPHQWERTIHKAVVRKSSMDPSYSYIDYKIEEQWVEPSGYVHLTPWIKPGSNGNQTLEIASKEYSHSEVAIDPRYSYACSLQVFELDDECDPYCGKYKDQEGPLVSLLYKNGVNCLKE